MRPFVEAVVRTNTFLFLFHVILLSASVGLLARLNVAKIWLNLLVSICDMFTGLLDSHNLNFFQNKCCIL